MPRLRSMLAGLAIGSAVAVFGSGVAFADAGDQPVESSSHEKLVTSKVMDIPWWGTVHPATLTCEDDRKLANDDYHPGNFRITPGVEVRASGDDVDAVMVAQRDSAGNRIGIKGGSWNYLQSMITNWNLEDRTAEIVLHCIPK